MELKLRNKVALVTGAGQGLGRSHALALAKRGAKVVVNDLGTDLSGDSSGDKSAQHVVAEIVDRGGSAIANSDSVTEPDGGNRMVAAALEAFGRLDIVVNNAGILDEVPLVESTRDHVRRVIDVHLIGTMNVIRASWAQLVASGSGRVINTSSGAVFGSIAGTAYQAAKAGIFAVTKSAAMAGELDGVKVNAILPTAFTRMTENIPDETFRNFMRSTFQPERVSELVVVLAHDRCPISGECVLTGGGRIARVSLAVSSGYISESATAEDFAAHLEEAVRSDDALFVPRDRVDEFASYIGNLGFANAQDLHGTTLSRGADR